MLVGRLARRAVAVGENFRFGHRAQGDAGAAGAADARFDTRVVPLLEVDGEVVSSSHIRGLVARRRGRPGGAASSARRSSCAARSSPATGGGASSASRRPTSSPTGARLPGHGVYACLADGRPAAVSIGVRPTFETGRGELIEAYVIDFDGDLYGHELRLEFLERLRGERRFETVEALVEQMHADVERAREICAAPVAPAGRPRVVGAALIPLPACRH